MKASGYGNNATTAAAAMVKHSNDSSTERVRPHQLSSVSAMALAMMPRNRLGMAWIWPWYQPKAMALASAMNTRSP